MADDVERIPQHRHCLNCNKAFVGDGRYCSEACENGRVSELKKKRNNLLIVWGIAVAIMVVAIVCSL
ncbi:MAG: DUF2116 family Zn-ribbon domain-containing protein [Candidatus Methanomethylophilaceae archaeon]|nr:DUF2116 family Zn-ribbon domain-containing protein [Candidatus Methanomethylophilaceae archaeon]MDY5872530.1 DUF2116 family Zn-ribbon domain-containing protein [Candidatus Methanomethylophilaceae archaeon]